MATFKVTSEGGSTIELEAGMTVEVEINGVVYEISVKQL